MQMSKEIERLATSMSIIKLQKQKEKHELRLRFDIDIARESGYYSKNKRVFSRDG
jgi:hypothetical protein